MDITSVNGIVKKLLGVIGAEPGTNVQLTEEEIYFLCEQSKLIFSNEPVLLELIAPMKVVGDIYGQYYDLLRLFDLGGFPANGNYLFLGNYVDFGKQSIETICLLLAYKIKYPDNVFLLRGCHERAAVNKTQGFLDECEKRFNSKVWEAFNDCFKYLPVAAIFGKKIFCCHGELNLCFRSMEQIREIRRPTNSSALTLCDSLANLDKYQRTFSNFYIPEVTEFLKDHDMDLICRGHLMAEDGYKFFENRKVVTIFSAPNFHEYGNAAAIMTIEKNLTCSFQILR